MQSRILNAIVGVLGVIGLVFGNGFHDPVVRGCIVVMGMAFIAYGLIELFSPSVGKSQEK